MYSAGTVNTNEDTTHQLRWKHDNTSWPYIRKKDCWDSNLEAEDKEITSWKQGIVLEEYAILLQNN